MKESSNQQLKTQILVVENDPDVRFIITSSLSSLNAIISEAENGQIALDLLKDKKYELIITDLEMPVLGGKKFIETFRQNSKNSFTPILVLTANTELDTKISILEAGGDDYLTKPFNNRDLLAKTRVLLRLNDITSQLLNKNIELIKSNETILSLQEKLINEERIKTQTRLIVTSLHRLRQPLTNAVLSSEMLNEDNGKYKTNLKNSLLEIEKILKELESLDTNNIESYINNIEMIRD